MKFIKISWEQYEQDCIALAKKVSQSKVGINRMVVISRGGLVIGRIFSDLLNLPISHITISSYSDLKKKKDIRITEVPKKTFTDEKLLLLDEISDSGKTFERARSYFKKFPNCKTLTACLYIKPITKPLPDFWQEKYDGWVIFPYEVKETYDAFVKMFKSIEKAKEKMNQVGFENWEIN